MKPDLYRPSRLAMLASRMKRLREEADAFLDAIGHRPGSRGEQSHRRPSRRTRSSGSTFSPVPAISRQWSDRPSKHTHASAEWKKKRLLQSLQYHQPSHAMLIMILNKLTKITFAIARRLCAQYKMGKIGFIPLKEFIFSYLPSKDSCLDI